VLDDMGLEAALRHYIDRFVSQTGVKTSLTLEGIQLRLPGDIETILFRIAQEALTNIVRHSGADHAWISLSHTEYEATLIIKDDGCGFDQKMISDGAGQIGWGLLGIRERVNQANGKVAIQSEPEQGVALTVNIPLNHKGRKECPPSN
jgi:signal transduction histidine kinase